MVVASLRLNPFENREGFEHLKLVRQTLDVCLNPFENREGFELFGALDGSGV